MAGTVLFGAYGAQILVRAGHPWGKVTRKTNGADIYPGMPVTETGETFPDVAKCAAAGDTVLGVVECPPDCDVDTVIPNDKTVEVYLKKSANIVRMWHAGVNGGSVVAGDIVYSLSSGGEGHIEPMYKHAAYAGDATLLATFMAHDYVGISYETHASNTANVPIKVILQ